MSEPQRVLVMAPNWLGDAVMALPAIADVRRAFPSARLIVSARRPVVDVIPLGPPVDDVVALQWSGRWWARAAFAADAARLRDLGADVAILLPNSFASAWLVKQAGIPARWGYASDLRRALLSRAVRRPSDRLHQGAYYQHLTRALGIASGPSEPVLSVPERAAVSARRRLLDLGWDGVRPVIVLAPGAAYGGARRWIPRHVARLATDLVTWRHVTCALVGSRGDAAVAREILGAIGPDAASRVLDMTPTTIEVLAGTLGLARACVSNDSGAMHVAAAVGTPLVALFGPTDEHLTSPLTRSGARADVLTHPVWCRPCRFRECPIGHRCMKGITPERVLTSVDAMMGRLDAASAGG